MFHSVSAFCNAGFDLMGVNSPFSSLTDYVGDPLLSNVIAFLIIIGGVGFLTWNDIREHKLQFRRYRLQSVFDPDHHAGPDPDRAPVLLLQ